jgi:L-histidine N-alpha-methyltransferase
MSEDVRQQQRDADVDAYARRLADDVRRGLSAVPRGLPCKYLYDDRGSQLFDEITRQPEYYQTRTEEAILEREAANIVARVDPRELVELGSGVGRKVRLILDAMQQRGTLESCVMFDINDSFLRDSLARLEEGYPELRATGLHGDLEHDLELLGPGGGRLIIFLAGTIGNLDPAAVPEFCRRVGKLMEPGDGFLVGLDMVKDAARLNAAYNDAAGVTADFNKNILESINRELGGNFDLDAWEHAADWDPKHEFVDIRLRSLRDQTIHLAALDMDVNVLLGEEIRTEISAKYTRASFARRLDATGLDIDAWYVDDDELFALALLRKES